MSQLIVNLLLIAMLLSTQLVMMLYGAGIRRPFGSLSTIRDLPPRLRNASRATIIADVLFVIFLAFMWWFFLAHMNWLAFLLLAVLFGVLGDYLSHRIRLVPSFYISLALVAICLIWAWQYDDGQTAALTAAAAGY